MSPAVPYIYVGDDPANPVIDSDDVALVVIDMQEYFCRPDSVFAGMLEARDRQAAEAYQDRVKGTVIPNILRLLDHFRARGKFIGFTEYGSYTPEGTDLPAWARTINMRSAESMGANALPPLTDPSARVISEFDPQPGEIVFPKTTSGPLAGTSMDQALRSVAAEWVIVTGVVTDVCVLGAARELADAGFKTIVAEDGCATAQGQWQHEAALQILQGAFSDVLSTDEILRALTR